MRSSSTPAVPPRPLPRFLFIGFVGKRLLGNTSEAAVAAAMGEALDALRAEQPAPHNEWVGISAMADGADTLFAEVLAARGMLHQIFLPEPTDRFFDPKDFGDPERSKRLLDGENVIEIRVASRHENRRERFAEAAGEIVDKCDVLLAVCSADEWQQVESGDDGPVARGGTAETLRHARRLARRTVVLRLPKNPEVDRVSRQEWTAPAIPGTKARAWASAVFDSSQPPAPLAGLDFIRELEGIKSYASAFGGLRKKWFGRLGGGVLLAHVLATLVAALVAVFGHDTGFWHSSAWSWLKAALLITGLGLAFVLHHWRKQTQGAWLEARMIAEICRSTLALARPAAFPGSLRHLRDFHLPELHDFVQALNVLHLRSLRRTRGIALGRTTEGETTALDAFVKRYLADRVANQRDTYYAPEGGTAHRRQERYERCFFILSGLALFGAILAAVFPPDQDAGAVTLLWLKFGPLFLPVAAAAVVGLMGLLDLDRRTERYRDMVVLLDDAREQLRNAATPAILRSRVQRLEHALLQEVVEWHAKMRHHRAG